LKREGFGDDPQRPARVGGENDLVLLRIGIEQLQGPRARHLDGSRAGP
jgi:hypothetical protein